jgi:hypothetical protein
MTMSSVSSQSIVKSLVANMPHGQPFGLAELAAHGVSPNLAAKYARTGWLQRLAQGVYCFPNDVLQLDACLLFLQKHLPDLHVGGKSALSWQGIRHNVSSAAKLQLWGAERFHLPGWFTQRFPARYLHRTVFVPGKPLPEDGYFSLSDHAVDLQVSCRERALLEVLDEVGVTQDLEEAQQLFEGFTSLRIEVMGQLLEACARVKTVRLFLLMAERTGVVDVAAIQSQYALRLGSDARWSRRLPDGSVLNLKKPC